MATYNEPLRPLEFLISEANGQRSREKVTLAPHTAKLEPGTVLGRRSTGAVVTASGSGTTLTVATLTSGKLAIGQTISGTGVPAGTKIVAYGTGVGGTGTYTTSQATTSDSATITASGPGEYAPFDDDLADGTETAAGVLAYPAEANDADEEVTIIARDAEVQADLLQWASGNDADDKANGIAELAAIGIVAR
jgi:hypothetical protein